MEHSSLPPTKRMLRRGAGLASAGLIIASFAVIATGSAYGRSSAVAIATAAPLPSSLCGSDEGDYVRQAFNGDFTACVRVPNMKSPSVVVALAADLLNTPLSSNAPTTITTTSTTSTTRDRVSSLTLSPSTATPGATVVVNGRLSAPSAERQTFATLCWDGCNALQEEGVAVHWSSHEAFRMTLRVPDTAWVVSRRTSAYVHPLTSGRYEVGVQCLTALSGCALVPAEAQSPLQLNAPATNRCVGRHPCETMSLSTSKAVIGEEISVTGWAPLQDIIGRPSSYSLSLTPGSSRSKFPPFAFDRLSKVGDLQVVLTPRTVRIEPSQTWASLGLVHYSSSTYSGPSAIAPLNNTNLVAWCQPSGVVVTGGASTVRVPIRGVRAALRGSVLRIFEHSATVPACTTVQLDPRFSRTVYAGFETAQGSSVPPVYLAPLYTLNDGATWHRVPTPPGSSIEDFGGFATEGNQVSALFANSDSYSGNGSPIGTNHDAVAAEVTTDGGRSWTSTTLGCPENGPCTTFGPYFWGNCNMSNQTQSLLVGPAGATAATNVRWTSSSWVTTVDSCYPQQLVVSSSREMFLLDPSSQYPLLQSTDSGNSWTYRSLPPIAEDNYGADSPSPTNSLVLAPDGSLFAVVTSPSELTQSLYRLAPSAATWCEVPHVFGKSIATSGVIGPLRVNRTDLLWGQTPDSNAGATAMTMHLAKFADLEC